MSEAKEKCGKVSKKIFRILLVDDDPDIIWSCRTCLVKNGFAVDTFNNPLQALSSFRQGAYDLLLLDIRMPKMSGLELFREIEKMDKNVKVSFITSFVTYYESLKEIYPDFKVNCVIKKPIESDNLMRRIKEELNIVSL